MSEGEDPDIQVEKEEPVSEEAETTQLTPEEQMALYEEALKESDWGHQPF